MVTVLREADRTTVVEAAMKGWAHAVAYGVGRWLLRGFPGLDQPGLLAAVGQQAVVADVLDAAGICGDNS